MKALIEIGIKIVDPSFNRCFVTSANEIHKSKVSDYLVERFPNSNLNTKRGIFRLFYWVPLNVNSEEYKNRLLMLLEEYRKTKSKKLKEYITRNLPEKLSDYPKTLTKEAKRYLEEKKASA